jgi:hypothetical protein
MSVSVTSWVPGGTNTRAALRDAVGQALADMALTGTVE